MSIVHTTDDSFRVGIDWKAKYHELRQIIAVIEVKGLLPKKALEQRIGERDKTLHEMRIAAARQLMMGMAEHGVIQVVIQDNFVSTNLKAVADCVVVQDREKLAELDDELKKEFEE